MSALTNDFKMHENFSSSLNQLNNKHLFNVNALFQSRILITPLLSSNSSSKENNLLTLIFVNFNCRRSVT
jgi:hypothetical protein